VWQQISPRLPEKRAHWWDFFSANPNCWMARTAPMGCRRRNCSVVLAAFIAGRLVSPSTGTPVAVDQSKVRERILVLAVGEHLGRSEMILVELANSGRRVRAKSSQHFAEQRRAEDLLEENRCIANRVRTGRLRSGCVLDELERVLLDVAHSRSS